MTREQAAQRIKDEITRLADLPMYELISWAGSGESARERRDETANWTRGERIVAALENILGDDLGLPSEFE